MATAPFEILAGPAKVYIAAVGTAFPDVATTPGASWTYMGETEGGITAQHAQTVELLRTDQTTGPRKAIRTEEELSITFSLAEITLERFAKVLTTTVTTDAGPPATKSIPLYQGFDVARYALLCRGPSPYGDWNMDYQIPVVSQTEEPEVQFTREDKSVLTTKWVSIKDPDAATDAERFGKLIAQSA